ncbi:hypothetical protein, partial [Escherichia coli]|uniref:hypothetical protein n=1 Tax=Escherichia coli TaxID=562 RepID=UPI001BE3DC7C
GDRVQMGFVVFNLDNAENVELSPTLDEDDANLPNTANMVYGVLEVEEFVKQETVLAGMVTPTSIERANLQYSTSLQIADGANVPVGAGSTT